MSKISFPAQNLVTLLLIRAPVEDEKSRVLHRLKDVLPRRYTSETWKLPSTTPYTGDISKPMRVDPQNREIVVISEDDTCTMFLLNKQMSRLQAHDSSVLHVLAVDSGRCLSFILVSGIQH
jgi:hypothetical protein